LETRTPATLRFREGYLSPEASQTESSALMRSLDASSPCAASKQKADPKPTNSQCHSYRPPRSESR